MSNKDNSHLHSSLKYCVEQFDKSILFIASGALGISFAFIKDIVPDFNKAITKHLLIGSWYIYAGVIFVSLVNHFISMMAHTWSIENSKLSDKDFNNGIKRWNWCIRIINFAMILSLLIGTVLLINFIKNNI